MKRGASRQPVSGARVSLELLANLLGGALAGTTAVTMGGGTAGGRRRHDGHVAINQVRAEVAINEDLAAMSPEISFL